MKVQIKLILNIIIVLTFLGCSSDNDSNNTIDENNSEPVETLTITSSKSISNTPFSMPREAIIFDDDLYVVNEMNTYKYDFSSNNWETVNTNSVGVALFPYFDYNVSFIREGKWNIINENALWTFDFSTNNWEKIKEFTDNALISLIGIYHNNSLFLFSDIFDKVYKYDFENNTLIEHSTFDQRKNYGQLVKSVFKIGETYYFTKLSNYNKISIYKWTDNFTKFQLLNEYQSEYIAQGAGFVYNDNIIFGLGGEAAVGNNDKFYYYNITTNEFKEVKNNFYEGRYVSIPVKHNNKFYLIGGQTITNNESISRETLDQVVFEFIEE
ncbi:hypothetical protein HN014_15105 [Aquimarina sp. TRL1]|uniref:hypothetical protein n=1 Tax=Aquimarina sp. (strain TRL1) TaxID=2736252 RepID=UPI00158BCFFF|nr:hypothetical protein [Aquimarina sp. TRL1]QKX06181.1 hypothetical protein HN014_15105 [Aquimarina sp. TRL1]